ncbi:hypothetical protein [Helicobacter pylori]|uniref:hypothetical protein n=1 Tax=Helicobacter pylori TaxID=210 RepID=UPI00130442E9|nr:hypothetical protein [Helicobacter pylori]
MQEISAYKLIKEKLHAIPNLRHKGSLFEKISKQFLPKTNALKPLAFSYGDTRRNAFRR